MWVRLVQLLFHVQLQEYKKTVIVIDYLYLVDIDMSLYALGEYAKSAYLYNFPCAILRNPLTADHGPSNESYSRSDKLSYLANYTLYYL